MNTFEQRRGLEPLPHALISYSQGKCKCVHTFYSLSERRVHDKLIKEMVGNHIECSSHGWLFLYNKIDRQSCQLFNPVSMATIQLPQLSRSCYDFCALSCDPNDPNCIVMMIKAEDRMGMARCYFCRPGDVLWNEKHLVFDDDDYIRALGCYKGQICIFTLLNKIYLVAANPPYLTLTDLGAELITRSPQHYERFHDYLVESDGELFVIQSFQTRMDAYDFVVFKLDMKEKRFVAVNCLGGRAFFLTPFSLGISCSTKKYGIKADTIYFTESFDPRIFSFELQNKVLSFSLPCPNVKSNLVQVEWILPLTPSPLCKVDNIAPMQIKYSTMKQPLVCISAGKYRSRYRVDITNSAAKKLSSKFVGRDWSELPYNLLISIGENLSYVSCVRIATVCKSWGSPITWVPKKFSGCPLFLHMTSSSIELFHFMNESSCSLHVEENPEILSIEQAKYGWLLITKYGGKEIFFLNPLTTEKIEIPDLPEDNICGLCFTSFPTSSNCSVFGIFFYKIDSGSTISFIYHIRRGEMKWTKVKIPQFDVNVSDFAFIPYGNPTFHKGLFYWIWGCGNLGAYDPTKGEVKFLDEPRSPCNSMCKSYLFESKEKLMSIWVEKHGKWIKVYQLDEASMSWEKVNSLDNKVVFLSVNSNLVVEMEGMEDMIIFNRFVKNQPLLYSLKTGELRLYGLEDYIIQDFCDISEYHIKSAWIKPYVKRHSLWELSWRDVLFNISQLFVTD